MSQVCIDSMKFAYRCFIRCRAFGKNCPPLFDFFEYAMSEVLSQGALAVFVAEEAIFETVGRNGRRTARLRSHRHPLRLRCDGASNYAGPVPMH